STNGNLASWSGTDGQILLDSGIASSNVPTLSGNNAFAGSNTFKSGTSGIIIDDATVATKQLFFDLSGATSSTKTTLTISQTADRVVTLPDATTTLAGLAVAQTFSALNTFSAGVQYATSGGTATTLNYYEEGTFTATYATAVSTTATWRFVRMGSFVSIQIPALAATNAIASGLMTITGMPSRILPVTNQADLVIIAISNNIGRAARLRAFTTTTWDIAADAAGTSFS